MPKETLNTQGEANLNEPPTWITNLVENDRHTHKRKKLQKKQREKRRRKDETEGDLTTVTASLWAIAGNQLEGGPLVPAGVPLPCSLLINP